MTITDNSLEQIDEPYQRQMTSYRRTRGAILEGAKSLLASVGMQRANMVDIADTAQVSRATLYNHFRDKNAVMRALLESEVERVFQVADSDVSPEEALARISIEISSDPALATMRATDPALLTQILTHGEDQLWEQIRIGLSVLIKESLSAELARLWLIGQVMQPLTREQSCRQANLIHSRSQ